MALLDMFRKPNQVDDAFAEMEDDMSALVELDMLAPSLDAFDDVVAEPLPELAGPAAPVAHDDSNRLTGYTQSWLATLTAFEETHRSAQADLDKLASTIAKVTAAQHSASSFINTVHGSLLRANELELSNIALIAENRRLSQAADRVKRLSGQLESLTEGYRRKETRFGEESDAMRNQIGVLQQELNELRSERATLEAERADLLNQVAGKSTALERVTREAEVLRERHVNIAVDLENTQRRHTEVERKYNELQAIHAGEHALVFELRSKLAETEKEAYRLQRASDSAQSRLVEAQEALTQMEADAARRDALTSTENQKLRGEVESLRARLEVAGRLQQNADNEIVELKQRVAELTTDQTIAAERISSLSTELSTERKLAAQRRDTNVTDEANAVEQEIIGQQARELDKLRRDHAAMRATLSRISSNGPRPVQSILSVQSDEPRLLATGTN